MKYSGYIGCDMATLKKAADAPPVAAWRGTNLLTFFMAGQDYFADVARCRRENRPIRKRTGRCNGGTLVTVEYWETEDGRLSVPSPDADQLWTDVCAEIDARFGPTEAK